MWQSAIAAPRRWSVTDKAGCCQHAVHFPARPLEATRKRGRSGWTGAHAVPRVSTPDHETWLMLVFALPHRRFRCVESQPCGGGGWRPPAASVPRHSTARRGHKSEAAVMQSREGWRQGCQALSPVAWHGARRAGNGRGRGGCSGDSARVVCDAVARPADGNGPTGSTRGRSTLRCWRDRAVVRRVVEMVGALLPFACASDHQHRLPATRFEVACEAGSHVIRPAPWGGQHWVECMPLGASAAMENADRRRYINAGGTCKAMRGQTLNPKRWRVTGPCVERPSTNGSFDVVV